MPKAKILGKLRGIIASAKEKSRNNRLYTEGFWDAKFNSDLFKEGIDNKMFLGCLYHPDSEEEYEQIHCDDRSAVVLTDVKKTEDLDYIGTFEILPTKAGQCLRNLLDIGCKFGISSRGLADYDSDVFDESMANNYNLITWDIVAFPGLKCCRLEEVSPVSESLRIRTNKTKIMENLNKLSENDREMKQYINKTLKAKEDFDEQLQVEDLLYNNYNIPLDLLDYANVVSFDDEGKAVYNDGEHGEKEVVNISDNVSDYAEPGKLYLVDNIFYDENRDKYLVIGDWTLLN